MKPQMSSVETYMKDYEASVLENLKGEWITLMKREALLILEWTAFCWDRILVRRHIKPLVAVLALISAGQAAADCQKAADWARAFYSEHYFFYAGEPDPILQSTTPEFGALLKKEWAYSKGEVGHFDYDPWLGAQDGEIGKPVRFSVESESPDIAIVSMSYPYVLDPKHPPERHTVHLILHKGEHECWHLHDFITPLGDSLSYVFSAAEP